MIAVTWLGHATTLLDVGGVRVLTDPVLGARLAHLTRRVPVLAPDAVQPVHAILLSHAHRDHLDLASLRAVGRHVPIIAPRGAAWLLGGLGPVTELAAGESADVRGLTITATPAVHEVRRGWRSMPALGFLVGRAVYFAGDTDLFDDMAVLAPLRLALLPVWGWGPTLGAGHLDPERAAEAAALLRPEVAVPIHWGTYFPLGLGRTGHPALRDPPLEFAARAAELAPATRVRVLQPGARLELDERA